DTTMSLKSVDMQIAVHKNTDAAHFQKQLQDKPGADQAVLASGQLKNEIIKRRRSEGTTKTEQGNIDSSPDENKKKGTALSEHKTSTHLEKDVLKAAEHPYKGHRLDLSL
ncbi:MAG: hypothetical protein K6T85_18110, partial [Gorillibacterium sp.]|nr:hypothetical protein [Gorillibacterium sp.]